nr:hypothetical protein [Tanacetum cinerariifolium]
MTQQELMVFYTTLSKKVDSLETDLKQTKQIYGAAYTKLIKKVKKLEKTAKFSQARRRARIVFFNDEDDLENPSKQYDTAEKDTSTAELSTPPIKTTTIIKDEDLIIAQTLMKMRCEKSKEKVKETRSKEKSNETATRPTKGVITREASQTTTKLTVPPQQKLGPKDKAVEGYSFDEIKTLFETTTRRVNTFVLIESAVDRAVPELAVGSSKRDAKEELDHGGSKRQRTGESSKLAEEPRDKETDNCHKKSFNK